MGQAGGLNALSASPLDLQVWGLALQLSWPNEIIHYQPYVTEVKQIHALSLNHHNVA
jgi:hypothetical protein